MTKNLTTAQIKVGDKLVRKNDHLGRPDTEYEVLRIEKDGKRRFHLAGYSGFQPVYASQLSADRVNVVVRDGVEIGSFFVKYW